MSTIDFDADEPADDVIPPGGLLEQWDEEWLPEWINVEDDDPAPEQPDPELEEQLAADLEAVERLVASLLTESGAAFEASVGGWEPDEPDEPENPPAAVEPAADLSSVGFSLGVARPVPAPVPLPEPPPEPAVVSPPAPRRRRRGWLVAPLVLLLAGAVIGTFIWAGSSRRPTPAAAVLPVLGLSTSSALPTWSRPSDSAPTEPVRVTTSAPSTSAPVTSAPRVHHDAPRRAAHTSAAPPVAPQHLVAPSITVPPPSPTGTGADADSTSSSDSSSCTSAGNTSDTSTQTTDPTATSTETTTATQTSTTTATQTSTETATQTSTETSTQTSTETSTQTSTATDTSTPTLASQPTVAAAVSCSG